MNGPYTYDQINVADSYTNPLGITLDQNGLQSYLARYLLQKAMSVFKWDLPKSWDHDYFVRTLYTTGLVAIIKTEQFGVIPQECTLTGFNVFRRPTHVVVANSLLPGYPNQIIGKDCVLFKLTSDYGSIMDLVNYYSQQFALTCSSYSCNVISSRLSYIFGAKSDVFAQSFKALADQILSGKPVSVVDKKMFEEDGSLSLQMFEQNVGANFIAPELQSCVENLWNRFCTDVGLTNTNRSKKERMVTDEVNANNEETKSMADMWLDGWKRSVQLCSEIFGVEMSVDWRFNNDGGVDNVLTP